MSVTYLFVGGPSHGALIAWPEEVPEIMVPVSGPGHNGYGREYYVTAPYTDVSRDGSASYKLDLAIHAPLYSDRTWHEWLMQALVMNFPTTTTMKLRHGRWVGAE